MWSWKVAPGPRQPKAGAFLCLNFPNFSGVVLSLLTRRLPVGNALLAGIFQNYTLYRSAHSWFQCLGFVHHWEHRQCTEMQSLLPQEVTGSKEMLDLPNFHCLKLCYWMECVTNRMLKKKMVTCSGLSFFSGNLASEFKTIFHPSLFPDDLALS